MEKPLGPWSDPRVTDTNMLVDLARLNSTVAVGILANPHLSSSQVTAVIEYADLTYKNVGDLGTAGIIASNRTTEEMLRIIEATYRRSKPAARHLVSCAQAAVAEAIVRRARADNSPMYRRLKEYVLEGVLARSYREGGIGDTLVLYGLVLPEFTGIDFAHVYETLVHAAQTEAEVLGLVDTFDLAERECNGEAADPQDIILVTLLLASLPYPRVVKHWAKTHSLGRTLLEGDPREEYQDLTDEQLAALIGRYTCHNERFEHLAALGAMETPTEQVVSTVFAALTNDTYRFSDALARHVYGLVEHLSDVHLNHPEASNVRQHLHFRVNGPTGGERKRPTTLAPESTYLKRLDAYAPSSALQVKYWGDGNVSALWPITLHRLTTAEQWVAYIEQTHNVLCGTIAEALDNFAQMTPTRQDTNEARNALFGDPLDELV